MYDDFGVDEYDEVADFWEVYYGYSDVDEEDDGLLHDPDFADSGTAWFLDEPKERAIHADQIASQRALRRADEPKKNSCSTFHLPYLQGPKRERKRLSFVSGKSIKS